MDAALDAHNAKQLDLAAQKSVCLAKAGVKEKPHGRLTVVIEWRDHCVSRRVFSVEESELIPAFKAG